ncbi:hypothetical protein ACHAXM_002970 [Skeletonema potamos]
MRAEAAPFVPSVLLNSSNDDGDGCTKQKKEQQHQHRQQRRRRGEKLGSLCKDNSSCHQDENPSTRQPKQNKPHISSSQTAQRQKLQQHRKRRPGRRKQRSSNNPENSNLYSISTEQKTIGKNGINYEDEDCFPVLASKHTCTTTDTRADSSWDECLASKILAISDMEQQQQQDDQLVNYHEDKLCIYFKSDVQLTKLAKPYRRIIKDDGFSETQNIVDTTDNIGHVQSIEDDVVLNARWKWNDAQLSKMRQRWWNAVREKQMKDTDRAEQYKSLTSLCRGELEDSSTSSDSSSIYSIEDDGLLQPPSLSKPFDEMPVEQTAALLARPPRVSVTVLDMETLCCETPYPLHAIIYLHALQNNSNNGLEDSVSTHTKSDSEVVVHRLLTIQEQNDVERWKMEGVTLQELCQFRTPSTVIKNLLSVIEDLTSIDKEMTPLQLAVVLNCPDIVRVLCSNMATFSMISKNESEQGWTSLLLACELGHVKCIKALLCSLNIKLDYRERRGGHTAYHFCCLGRRASNTDDINYNYVSAFDTLMSHTPNALQKRVLLLSNREGRNIVHMACARGDLSLLKCVLGHLSNVSSQMPWKALSATDRFGHTPFISAVHAGRCEIASHLLVTRFPAADYSVLFSACPMTIAASNYDTAMASLLFEMGYDTQSTTSSEISPIIRYDINRSLLELMLIRLDTDGGEEGNTDNYELIRLLVANGANPHKAISIRNRHKPKTRGDYAIATLTSEEDTPLSIAVMASDFKSIECMLQSYMHALTVFQSLRRNDPLLISQPESYFIAVEERETDTIQYSLQSALVKALFFLTQSGGFEIGKCCLVLYKRGVPLSQMNLQWLEKCISLRRLVLPSSFRDDTIEGYNFEAPLVHYSLPNAHIDAIECLNPYANVGTFMCWSRIFLDLPWTNKFSFNCKWLRKQNNFDVDSDLFNGSNLEDDEFYLVVENERLLLHKSIISARSGKLAAAIHFIECQRYDGKLCVSIDLPLLIAKMLICHCYHGSISFGLMASPLRRSEQLLELALVAEEYLCPSLLMEVEIRMLETKSNDCFCAYCSGAAMPPKDVSTCLVANEFLAHARQNIGECHAFGVYFYKATRIIASPSLISPESALNVLAVAKQLELSSSSQNGSYALKYTTKFQDISIDDVGDNNAGILTAPFLACKAAAAYALLRDFKLFMQRANKRDDHDDIPLITGEGEPGVDENCVLLLRTCLEELVQNQLRPKMTKNLTSQLLHHCKHNMSLS